MSFIPQSTPAVDWKETLDAHVLKADVPGLRKDDVKVEKEAEENNQNGRWRHVERPRGGFRRRFYLPASAKTDEVKASMENGVLTVTIPKQEIKKAEVKSIEIIGN
ncbi:18.1 kDa class i heat shock protein [Phtheirospermum japonicum]|uniref:18.1 kDa class i heat shock protein n=1 Tax=Phtheirospermum japonicum TaxID=374723 RepID=A0A830BMQ6_9LAMI|nr:18.1 kDa class i heat shock protein [Phtheirospermum japonicum]